MELSEILEMVLAYLEVLAWPLVVFTLALVYRKPLVTVLQRLKRYSGWGQTVELVEQARDLKEDSEVVLARELTTPEAKVPSARVVLPEANGSPDVGSKPMPERPPGKEVRDSHAALRQEFFKQIASIDPVKFPTGARRAVSSAWRSLLNTSEALAKRLHLDPGEVSLNALAVALVNRGLISKSSALIAFRLSELYSNIIHSNDRDLNIETVANFTDSAANLESLLAQVLESLNDDRGDSDSDERQR